MKALSEQLSELSTRSKKTEDVIAATLQQDRAKLETQRAALRSLVTTGVVAANDRASAARTSPVPSGPTPERRCDVGLKQYAPTRRTARRNRSRTGRTSRAGSRTGRRRRG